MEISLFSHVSKKSRVACSWIKFNSTICRDNLGIHRNTWLSLRICHISWDTYLEFHLSAISRNYRLFKLEKRSGTFDLKNTTWLNKLRSLSEILFSIIFYTNINRIFMCCPSLFIKFPIDSSSDLPNTIGNGQFSRGADEVPHVDVHNHRSFRYHRRESGWS